MVTIEDVAREAGVSVATVSRVLNHKAKVSEKTARRVEETIHRLSYEPSLLARNFRKSESRVVLILSPNITNPYYSHILTGIGVAARRLGYSFMICTTDGEAEQERVFLDMLSKKRGDGAIMLATVLGQGDIQNFADKSPIVQCSEFYPDTTVAHVAIDNYAAARTMMRYLLDAGHRRIATISSSNGFPSTRQRMSAYLDSLREERIPPRKEYIRRGGFDYNFSSGYAAARKLLTLGEPPTAIFCVSDMLALGAVSAAQELGLDVPKDVSITGFDDVELATIVRPNITTMAQPCHEIGRRAMELLYQLMSGNGGVCNTVTLDCRLVVRSSTGNLPEKSGGAYGGLISG